MHRRSAFLPGSCRFMGDFLKLFLQIQTKLKKFLIKEEKHYMIILYVLRVQVPAARHSSVKDRGYIPYRDGLKEGDCVRDYFK